jgi:hypothetical protein
VRYVKYSIWIALRPLVVTSMILAVIAVALTLASAVLLIPIGVICADAFAFCRW